MSKFNGFIINALLLHFSIGKQSKVGKGSRLSVLNIDALFFGYKSFNLISCNYDL